MGYPNKHAPVASAAEVAGRYGLFKKPKSGTPAAMKQAELAQELDKGVSAEAEKSEKAVARRIEIHQGIEALKERREAQKLKEEIDVFSEEEPTPTAKHAGPKG